MVLSHVTCSGWTDQTAHTVASTPTAAGTRTDMVANNVHKLHCIPMAFIHGGNVHTGCTNFLFTVIHVYTPGEKRGYQYIHIKL